MNTSRAVHRRRPSAGTLPAVLVAHHPPRHPYVDHACGPVARGHDVDVWDLPSLSDAGVQVVHLHFGFETRTTAELAAWASELRRRQIGLVHTVHDIDNPHLVDQSPFHRLVAVVVAAADLVLTLTPAAAADVAERFGSRPMVVAHPHVVPLRRMGTQGDARRRGVYIHAGMVRPNLDVDLVAELAEHAAEVGGVRIHVRRGAEGTARGSRLVELARLAHVTVDIVERPSDEQLWEQLESAAAIVLPYRWGTHSGLLEAAHDLGTPVLAPLTGCYAEQGALPLRTGSLLADVRAALGRPVPVDPDARRRQRDALRTFHRGCYAAVSAR